VCTRLPFLFDLKQRGADCHLSLTWPVVQTFPPQALKTLALLGVVVYTYNPSTGEVEAGGS
jgi:hypothetical protein